MENQSTKLNRIVKISIIAGALIIGLSVAYYLVMFLPKKAVIQTAITNDEKSQDNQTIEELKKQNEEQQSQIDELKNPQDQQNIIQEQQSEEKQNKTQTENTTSNIVKPKNCSADLIKYCPSTSFTEPSEFKKFLKVYENSFSSSDYQKYKKQYTEQFNKCQDALKCE